MQSKVRPAAVGRVSDPRETTPKVKPVRVCAWLGVFFLAIEITALSGWILSGDAQRTPTGPTPIPDFMRITAHLWVAVGLVIYAAFIWFFLIKPWRREGHITLDGLLVIVWQSLFWQDSLANYFQTWVTYNTVHLNWGAWNAHVPGWLSPNGNLMAEPPLWIGPIFVYLGFGTVVLANVIMKKAKTRWPTMSNTRLVVLTFVFIAVFDAIFEPFFLMLGHFAYPGAIRWLSIFPGKYYQYPIYEAVLYAFAWTGHACLRYFKDDQGRTIAERGIDQLRVAGKRRTGVRFLALVGISNLIFLGYNVPGAIVGLYSDPWPKDITSRSYFLDGFCGEGTTYACPGPAIPIPRPDSLHIDPNGNVVVPEGTRGPGSG